MDMSLGEIARLVGGQVVGDAELRISGLNGIREAGQGELSFVRGGRYLEYVRTTQASALLMTHAPEACPVSVVEVPQPDIAFAQLLPHFVRHELRHPEGIHPQAVIGERVQLGKGVAVDAFVRIADDAVIGDKSVLYSGVYIGRGVNIGPGCVVYPNVTIREGTVLGARCIVHAGASIGSDGFGFAPVGGSWMKIPQVGVVHIGDDVEIGANSCVDRATFGVTRIGDGVKIDNLVQIGHNCIIGEHTVIAGMAGIAGSTTIGAGVRVGPAAGINGHIEIGPGATVAARAGVTKSLEAGKIFSGFPAMDHNLDRRVLVAQQRVPELIRRLRQLERQVQALEEQLHEQAEDDS